MVVCFRELVFMDGWTMHGLNGAVGLTAWGAAVQALLRPCRLKNRCVERQRTISRVVFPLF